jgi:CRISPR/Cas system-associated endonuclease Cas1
MISFDASVHGHYAVGFLHDFSAYQTKQSLAYDLQEPFRWLV